jgi:Flp pilus assembly pilin Flp
MMKIIRNFKRKSEQTGQALVEYALIVSLLVLALVAILSITGPAIADVFENVICNVAGQDPCGDQIESIATFGNPVGFWGTVTWVAQNPLTRPTFPTLAPIPPSPAPTSGAPPPPPNTPIPSSTVPPPGTLQATPVPPDRSFSVNFLETGNSSTESNWRLDNSVWLGGDDWVGYYYPTTNHTGTPTIVRNREIVGAQSAVALNFNWLNRPLDAPWTLEDNFSVRFVRRIEVSAPTPVTFRLSSDNTATLRVCATEVDARTNGASCVIRINNAGTAGGTFSDTISSTQWLSVSYVENTGVAWVNLELLKQGGINSADVVPSGGQCNWARRTSTQDTNTLDWMWDDNVTTDTWPANQRCVLELRGYVDLSGVVNPMLSFFDVWELPAGVNASVQVGTYNADPALITWQTINVRTGAANFRNYQWTRNQIPVPVSVGGAMAIRFVLESGATGGNPVRWHLDDIEVKPQTDRTFTVNSSWGMDTSADLEQFFSSGRWNVTTTRTHTGSGWEINPAPNHSQGGPRVHFIELAGSVNLNAGTLPAADAEGDTGTPTVSFYHSYQVPAGASLELQYTRDARDTVPDTWQAIPVGSGTPPQPGGALVPVSGSTANLGTMTRVEIMLDQIPNWNTAPFRLRWAMIVPAAVASTGRWWVDDIAIERFGGDRFAAYPFRDGAENTSFTSNNWTMRGSWGVQNGAGVREGGSITSNFYSDSPGGNFAANTTTIMEMRRWIDLFYDTDLNRNNPTGLGEPTPSDPLYVQTARRATTAQPMLVFWMRRDVAAGVTFAVDLTTKSQDDNNPLSDAEWDQVWSYVAPANGNDPIYNRWRQDAWQRIEIDLRQALQVSTGSNFATILSSASQLDDDIKVRFRIISGASTDDGVFIDGIQIIDLQRPVIRLWSGNPLAGSAIAGQTVAGNGATYDDTVDGAFPTTLGAAQQRWILDGGHWDVAALGRSATSTPSNALADSPTGEYRNWSIFELEHQPVIDLRGITSAQVPTLIYYQTYEVDGGQSMVFQVSQADAAQTAQDLGRTAGWSAWTTVASNSYYNEMSGYQRRNGWQRIQVNLTPYVGQQIRLRWVTNAWSTDRAAGWQIDDLRLFYNGSGAGTTAAIPLPFTIDQSASPARWIADGTWGQTFDWYNPATESAANRTLGSDLWRGRWANCNIITGIRGGGCDQGNAFNALNDLWPMPALAATAPTGLNPTAGDPRSTAPAARTQFAANLQLPGGQIGNGMRILVNEQQGSQGTLGIMDGAYSADASYYANVAGRFMRQVVLNPGVYVFQISNDDETRIRLNNGAGTSVSSAPFEIYNRGWMSRQEIQTRYLTVTAPITRVMVVDFWGGGGPNHLFLNVARLGSSFSDSPNWNGTTPTYSQQDSLNPSRTSLMLNGFFNTSGVANPTLRFNWLARQNSNTRVFMDVSTDGGFTWSSASTTPASWNDANTRFPADFDWQPVTYALPQAASVMIRFRYNTDSNTSDGVYITDVSVTSG